MKYIINGDMTTDKLRQIIQSWTISDQAKLEKYYNYFIGKHKILNKTYEDTSKPCNHIITNYCHQIVQQYLGYNIGIPVTYDVDDNIRDILNYNDTVEKDNLLLRNALIYGKAFELQYLDEDKKQRYDVIDTRYGIDVYDDELENDELKYFIRMYCVDNVGLGKDSNWRIELYDAKNVYIYSSNYSFSTISLLDTRTHNYGQVPVTVFNLNNEQESIFAQIMSLQDAYNTLVSSEIDDWEAFVDAYLVLKGVTADSEDAKEMRENRILVMDPDASAEYLTKQVNDSQIQNMLGNLKDMIFKMSNCPDFTDEKFMAQSGIALEYKLVGFSNVSKAIMNRMEKALRKRLELLQGIEHLKGESYADVKIEFTQNLPANTLDTAQLINQLRGVVSQKTLLSLLPFIDDVDEEMKLVDEENEKNRELYGFGDEVTTTDEDGDKDEDEQ